MADQSAPEYISASYDHLTYEQAQAEAYLAAKLKAWLSSQVPADGSNQKDASKQNNDPASNIDLETATAAVELVNDHLAQIAEVRDKLDQQIEVVEKIGELASQQAEEEARDAGAEDAEFMAAVYAAAAMEGVIPSDLFDDVGLV